MSVYQLLISTGHLFGRMKACLALGGAGDRIKTAASDSIIPI